MKKKQKEIFLKQEGNSFFFRNHYKIKKKEFGLKDPIIEAISQCLEKNYKKKSLLEIGCGEGKRLKWISKNLKIKCYGIEPSEKAVKIANSKEVEVIQGTADILEFEKNKFDFVIFGFCLYLCDRSDLFQIAKEADRVLKNNGYLIIRDFYSLTHKKKKYVHRNNIFSYKMDYRKLFDWHPNFTSIFHKISAHNGKNFTDNEDNWVSTSILKKKEIK